MRLDDLLDEMDAEAGDVTRYRVVGEHHGHDPAESVHGSCSQAMTHSALCHRIGRCDRVAVLEERLVRGRPAHPWAVWLFVDGKPLQPSDVQVEIVKGNAAEWCVPGGATEMDMLQPAAT